MKKSQPRGPGTVAGATGGQPLRIVIVTYNWPPRNAIGTHRPLSWARHWSAKGAKVTVLTATKYAFDEPLDLPEPRLPGIDVIEVPYLGRSSHLTRMLRVRWVKHALRRLRPLLGWRLGGGDIRLSWWPAAHQAAIALAGSNDVVVSTHGPSSAHLIADEMKKANPGLRWVADYRDSWHQNVYSTSMMTQARRDQERVLELDTIASADVVTAISSGLAGQISESTGKQVFCVPNGFDTADEVVRKSVAASLERTSDPTDVVRIVYTGIIYPVIQDAEPLFQAVRALDDQGAFDGRTVICDFYGSNLDPIATLARDSNYQRFIDLHGHVSRAEAVSAQRNATALVVFDNLDSAAQGVLTGKIFEYLAAGRPILSIGSRPKSPIAKLLDYTGCGVAADTPKRIAGALRDIIDGDVSGWFHPNVERILEFSRDRAAETMFAIVTDTAGVTGDRPHARFLI